MADRVVFVDESFHKWFGLPSQESNFCYAAVSLPESRLAQLRRFMEAFNDRLITFHEADTGQAFPGGEVKSRLIYDLTPETRKELAGKMAYFLHKNEGFLFTFFTTSQGLIHNILRDKYYDEYEKEYTDFLIGPDEEMTAVRDSLVAEWRDQPFNLALLEPLYGNLMSFVWTFHRELRETFRIQYDPRERGEDIFLNQGAVDAIALYDKGLQKLGEPGLADAFVGFDSSFSSADCPGLQLVDFIVADIRNLFRTVPGLREDSSEKRILSAKANPDMTLVGGRAPFYRRELRPSTFDQLGEVDLLFPELRLFLARSMISCHAVFGEARHINVSTGEIWDMAD